MAPSGRRSAPHAALALVAAACVFLLLPSMAGAHAQLLSTSPEQGAALKQAPSAVEFKFGEPVEVAFGAVRVFDQNGARVDAGPPTRPDGDSSIGVKLKSGLGDGAYTATYRVVSADSHPVSGGFSFTVGRGETAAPRSVASLVGSASPPKPLQVFYAAVRFVGYAALCLVIGVIFFWLWALLPFVPDDEPARRAFADRARRLVSAGAAAGLISALLALVCQAAVAGGTGLLAALNWSALSSVAETRSGFWMVARVGVWAALCIAWFTVGRRGETGDRARSALAFGIVAAAMPALVGHAAVTSPKWLMVFCDFAHIVAMAVWVGGLVAAAVALPNATRALSPGRRGQLLVAVFSRFSQVALVCVITLIATGALQTVVHFAEFADFWQTAFGRALLVKIGLLLVLIAFGAYNRYSVIPRLRTRVESGETPGTVGAALKRSLTAEIVVVALVIAAASALVSYPPAATAATGPYAADATTGPIATQLVVDPARQGVNKVHLYLTDAQSGRQYTDFKQLTVTASLQKAGIGPIALSMEKAGPGHYVDNAAVLAQTGDWTIDTIVRVSEFDQYEHDFRVKIR